MPDSSRARTTSPGEPGRSRPSKALRSPRSMPSGPLPSSCPPRSLRICSPGSFVSLAKASRSSCSKANCSLPSNSARSPSRVGASSSPTRRRRAPGAPRSRPAAPRAPAAPPLASMIAASSEAKSGSPRGKRVFPARVVARPGAARAAAAPPLPSSSSPGCSAPRVARLARGPTDRAAPNTAPVPRRRPAVRAGLRAMSVAAARAASSVKAPASTADSAGFCSRSWTPPEKVVSPTP